MGSEMCIRDRVKWLEMWWEHRDLNPDRLVSSDPPLSFVCTAGGGISQVSLPVDHHNLQTFT